MLEGALEYADKTAAVHRHDDKEGRRHFYAKKQTAANNVNDSLGA
jgi:hypothetical protein